MTGATHILLLGAAVSLAIVAYVSGVTELVSPAALVAGRQELRAAVDANPVTAVVAFLTIYTGVAALALPASTALTLMGGFLFGRWLGTGLVLVAATAGATIVFLIAQTAIGEPLRRRAGPLYERVATDAHKNAFSYMLFLRLVPLFPFPLVNLTAALLAIDTRTFILSTLIGIAPATFAYANFGRQIGAATSFGDVASPGVLIALSAIGCLALAPVAYRRLRPAGVAPAPQE